MRLFHDFSFSQSTNLLAVNRNEKDTNFPENVKDDRCNSEVNDVTGAAISENDNPRPGGERIILKQTYRKEIVLARNAIVTQAGRQPPLVTFSESKNLREIDAHGNHHAAIIPRYLNLEPSLAMDWLEIAWEELHLRERVGAGTSSDSLNCICFCFMMLSF